MYNLIDILDPFPNSECHSFIGRLTDSEVKRLWEQARIFKEDDRKNRERVKAKDDLENCAINAKSIAERTLSFREKRRIDEACDEVLLWLEDHRVWVKCFGFSTTYSHIFIIYPVILLNILTSFWVLTMNYSRKAKFWFRSWLSE